MLNLAIFYGGKSPEHDISIITALQVINNLDKKKYNIIPVYVSYKNNWLIPKNYLNLNIYASDDMDSKELVAGFFDNKLVKKTRFGFKVFKKIDVAINCMHGLNGEDGSLAGMLQLAGIPCVGSGVLASAVGMDKTIQKDIFVANNIPVANYLYFSEIEYNKNQEYYILKAEEKLNYPIVVKPANLGSSIGINISENREELQKNIKIALSFDKKVILEQKIDNLREINCSVMGNFNQTEISVLEEPKGWKEFLDFNEKYILSGKGKKDIDVKLPDDLTIEIKSLSEMVFRLLDCTGVVRIDFLLDNRTQKVYVNEINTIPGSYANYLWKYKYGFGELLDRLIELSIREYVYLNTHKYTFKTDVLNSYSNNKMTINKTRK